MDIDPKMVAEMIATKLAADPSFRSLAANQLATSMKPQNDEWLKVNAKVRMEAITSAMAETAYKEALKAIIPEFKRELGKQINHILGNQIAKLGNELARRLLIMVPQGPPDDEISRILEAMGREPQ